MSEICITAGSSDYYTEHHHVHNVLAALLAFGESALILQQKGHHQVLQGEDPVGENVADEAEAGHTAMRQPEVRYVSNSLTIFRMERPLLLVVNPYRTYLRTVSHHQHAGQDEYKPEFRPTGCLNEHQ